MTTKTKNECATNLCSHDNATRTRFFHGMLLTDEQLSSEQSYHREALKRLNRNLYGPGIVCGLEVEINGLCVKVNPGVAFDCCGNLIEVCKCVEVDFSKECEKRFGSDCKPRPPEDQEKFTKYLVLRYDEKETDPQPVLTPQTDCKPSTDKPECTASKVQEGFCIELWEHCPCPDPSLANGGGMVAGLDPPDKTDPVPPPPPPAPAPGGESAPRAFALSVAAPEGSPSQSGDQTKDCIHLPLPCVQCRCAESGVGLAKLTVDCKNRTVEFDGCSCRQYVLSPRQLNWLMARFQQKFIPKELEDMRLRSRIGYLPMSNLIEGLVAAENWGSKFNELEERLKKLEPPPGAGTAAGTTGTAAATTEDKTAANKITKANKDTK